MEGEWNRPIEDIGEGAEGTGWRRQVEKKQGGDCLQIVLEIIDCS